MDVLSVREESRIHRAVYGATLRAALKGRETHGEFAEHIGRTRQYLQYLLQGDDLRTPSRETAEQITNALALPPEQREDLLQHMLLAAERRLRARRNANQTVAEAMPAEMLEHMRSVHWAATYASDPAQARPHYRRLRDVAKAFLRQREVRSQPLVIVETCLLLHDALSVLDRTSEALFHAGLARTILERLDRDDYRRSRERFDHFHVNAPYAEAVTLITLGLSRQAAEPLAAAEFSAKGSLVAETFWSPHIYRHQLDALSGQSRFSLVKAREAAHRAQSACERRKDPLDALVSLLVDVSLARAYLLYGSDRSARTAYRLLLPAVDSLDSVPYLGPIHRVVTLRTFASVCRAVNRLDAWDHFICLALRTATAAGLEHQTRQIWQESRGERGPAGLQSL